jgi:hypothetical protein
LSPVTRGSQRQGTGSRRPVHGHGADRFNYALSLLDAHYVRYSPDGVHNWAGNKLDRAPSNTLTLGYERTSANGERLA